MPDKWEYPWYAAWDLAFHMIPFARIDPEFAKEQLVLLPARVVHAPQRPAAGLRVRLRRRQPAGPRLGLLARLQDDRAARPARPRVPGPRASRSCSSTSPGGSTARTSRASNLFAGGFLGLDNIGVFDRSKPLPTGGHLEQADGTAWMAFYCATMLSMALELARTDPAYEDIASKFFEHFVAIADAMNTLGGTGLWDEEDGFYYDQLHVGRPHAAAAGPLAGRADPAARRRGARRRAHRAAARLHASGWTGSSRTARTWPGTSPTCDAGRRQAATAIACWPSRRASGSSACCATCSTRTSSSRPTASARSRAFTRTSPYVLRAGRPGAPRRLRARRVRHAALRRQLELARPDLVPGQLPADRGAGALPPLLRRRRCRSSARPAPAG